MKKLFFVPCIVCLLAACETKYYSVLITNDTSKTVSFTYNDTQDTLTGNTSKTYEVKAYTPPPQNINVPKGALSVEMNQQGDSFTFVNVVPIELNIVNTLPIDVTIKAQNYIWDEISASIEVSILAQKERIDKLFIYTSKPNFTLSSAYPVVFKWSITDLKESEESEESEESDESADPDKPKKKMSVYISW